MRDTIALSVHAPLQVLTDAALWRHVSSFQSGLPLPLYHFWLARNPPSKSNEPSAWSRTFDIQSLVFQVVQHGTLELLKLTREIRIYERRFNPFSRLELLPGRWVFADLSGLVVINDIIKKNRADMLEWGLSQGVLYSEPIYLWQRAIDNCKDGDVRVLDVVLHFARPYVEDVLRAFFSPPWAAQLTVTDGRLFDWLHINVPGVVTTQKMIGVAVETGNLRLVQHLCEQYRDDVTRLPRFGQPCNSRHFRLASYRGHLTIMTYLLENCMDLVDLAHVELMLLESGGLRASDTSGVDEVNYELIKMKQSQVRVVVESKGYAAIVEALMTHYYASQERKIKLLTHLCQHKLMPSDARISIDPIAASGQLDLIRALHAKGVVTATTDAMDRAAEQNHWSVVQFLHDHRTEGCTTRVMDAAAKQGRLDYFKYLHRNRREGFSSQALELAATSGNIHMVRYILTLPDQDTRSANAMEVAAQRGHFDIVKFLHEHRPTTGMATTITALDNVPSEILQSAPALVTEEGIDASEEVPSIEVRHHPFKLAIENDHADVVRFLYEHYPTRFTSALLHCLLLHGVFDVWMQLRELYPDEADAAIESVLYEAGKQLRMNAICYIVNELGRTDLAFRAVDGAAEYHRPLHAQWLRAVVEVTGPQSCRLSAIHAAISTSQGSINGDNLQFLLRQCCEDNAKDLAIDLVTQHGFGNYVDEIEKWSKPEYVSSFGGLEPWILDPRFSQWAICILTGSDDHCVDPYQRCSMPLTLPVRAILHNDLQMLQLIHDSKLDATPFAFGRSSMIQNATFRVEGAGAAAVRGGNLPILLWLVETVGISIEPLFLEEAIEFQRYEIAEWLAVKCLPLKMSWSWSSYLQAKAKDPWKNVDKELLEWLETSSDAVREVFNLTGLKRQVQEMKDAAIVQCVL